MKYEMKLRIRIERSDDFELHLEPWGEQYVLAPGVTVDLVFVADVSGVAEIVETARRTTVYGWSGATVTLLRDGHEVTTGIGRIE